jgi:two-component system response regulator ResD
MMETQLQRILLVDDEQRIRSLMRMYLERENYFIDEADNGEDALRMALSYNYKLIVLDVMMPGMTGFEVCQLIRRHKQTPVLMLTARDDEYGKLEGFESGADDYVTKPFSPREVILRVNAILNRTDAAHPSRQPKPMDRVELPYITIETSAHRVLVMGKEVRLALKEFDLLFFMARHPNAVFSREELLNKVWRYNSFTKGDYRTVDTHVKRLREKLSRVSSAAAQLVSTIWGLGYSLRIPTDDDAGGRT